MGVRPAVVCIYYLVSGRLSVGRPGLYTVRMTVLFHHDDERRDDGIKLGVEDLLKVQQKMRKKKVYVYIFLSRCMMYVLYTKYMVFVCICMLFACKGKKTHIRIYTAVYILVYTSTCLFFRVCSVYVYRT